MVKVSRAYLNPRSQKVKVTGQYVCGGSECDFLIRPSNRLHQMSAAADEPALKCNYTVVAISPITAAVITPVVIQPNQFMAVPFTRFPMTAGSFEMSMMRHSKTGARQPLIIADQTRARIKVTRAVHRVANPSDAPATA